MSRHTKDRKLKQREKAQAAVREDNIEFDVLRPLRTENTDTKPNMGKFLKQYVKDVRALPKGMISFYPRFSYETTRVFVAFLDGHELMYDPSKLKPEDMYVCTYRYEDAELKQKDLDSLKSFFRKLFEFKFVHGPDVKPAACRQPDAVRPGIISDDDERRDNKDAGVEE